MTEKDTAVIDAYQEQYAALSDEELRQVVRGAAPWAEEARYTYSARCAAQRVLRSRGAKDIPRLPWFDPSEARLPANIRRGVVFFTILITLACVLGWIEWNPPSQADDALVCEAARDALRQTDFSYQHRLSLSDCTVDSSQKEDNGGLSRTPIRFRPCIELATHHIERLSEASPRRIAIIQRFATRPAPGRYCLPEPSILAYWVQRAGHPWWIDLSLLESE
jgi:hypothetical protein